jgi:hypothetical protein
MLFFLPPSIRTRYGPLIRVAWGVLLGFAGIFIFTWVLVPAAATLIVWGLVGWFSRSRAERGIVTGRQDSRRPSARSWSGS